MCTLITEIEIANAVDVIITDDTLTVNLDDVRDRSGNSSTRLKPDCCFFKVPHRFAVKIACAPRLAWGRDRSWLF